MSYIKFHKNFLLTGNSFESVDALLSFSKTISNDVFSFLKCWFDTKDFITVQTSGSTGKPTTIQLKKEYMINSALATGNYFDIHDKTKALSCLSPNYIAGKMMLVRALVLGWHLDIVKPNSHPLDITKNSYDFCAMVPLQLHNSLSQLHRIKKLIVGGGVVSDDLLSKLKSISTKVYTTYGMTETITHIAVKKLNNLDIHSTPNKGFDCAQPDICDPSSTVELSLRARLPARQGGTTWQSHENNYSTLPNIKLSTDNRDCLVIAAPKVAEIQIVTNDVVELISETEFKWLGRYDNIINSGGIKLIPEQIEKKLAIIIDKRFFVSGIPDQLLGEKLVLIIEDENYALNDEITTFRQRRIRNDKYIQNLKSEILNLKQLSKYEIPKEIYFVNKFIETETKKIQRQKTLDLINLK